MGKNKLAKFADMANFPHVFELPFSQLKTTGFIQKGQWNSFFKNNNPIILELGCGRGEYTLGLAAQNPNQNFIGVDIKGARMWMGAKESLEEKMQNVAFLRTNIECIDAFFAPSEVQEIWLTFSDPQMKKVNKRLTGTLFLQRYLNFLAPDGIVHLKTDSNFLFNYTLTMLIHNNIQPLCVCQDVYDPSNHLSETQKKILNIQTYYEQQWLSRGKTIKYLSFQLPQHATLKEPEIEIEMDDYRSYNRHKRSALQTSK